MPILLKGILLGFSLSFLVGPLLFTLVQAAIERGQKAGLAVAAGIWISDLFFVFAVLFFVERIQDFTGGPDFSKKAGLVGGLLLIGFGLANFFKKSASGFHAGLPSRASLATHFSKGFLINCVNPFNVFFWLGITGTVIVPNGWSPNETLVFFAGMLGTLVAMDVSKVFLAKKIGQWLSAAHIQKVRFFIGMILTIFGIVLIYRTL